MEGKKFPQLKKLCLFSLQGSLSADEGKGKDTHICLDSVVKYQSPGGEEQVLEPF